VAPGAPAAAFPTCCSPSGAAAPQKSHQGWRGIPGGKRRGHVPKDTCVKPLHPSRASSLRACPGVAPSSRSSSLLWGQLEGQVRAPTLYSLAKVWHLWTYSSLHSFPVNLHRNQVLGRGWEFFHFSALLEIYN